VRGVSEIINPAVDRSAGQLEHDVAVQIQTDLPLLTATLQARCAELPQLLETTREPGRQSTVVLATDRTSPSLEQPFPFVSANCLSVS
jgi:hypothetical protein